MTDTIYDPATAGVADGTAVTTSNSAFDTIVVGTGTPTPGIVYSTLFVSSASRALVYACTPSTSAALYLQDTGVAGATTDFAGSVEFYMSGLPTSTQTIVNVRNVAGTSSFYNLSVTAAGKLVVISDASSSVIGTSASSFAAAGWYRLDWEASNPTTTTGSINAAAYPVASATALSGVNVTATAINLSNTAQGTVRVGRPSSSGTVPVFYFGAIRFRSGSVTTWGPVAPPTSPPTALAVGTVTGHTVAFSSAGSTAVGPATITGRLWDFGNGVTSTTASPTYRYTTAGSYTVVLTITDSNGLTDTDTITVVPFDGAGAAALTSVTTTFLTPHGGTALAVLGDVDATTFDSGDATNKATLVGVFSALVAPLAGMPFVAVVRMDNWAASAAAVNAQIFDYNGTTQRSAVTNIPVPGYQSVADGGIAGTGSLTAGVVNKFVALEFPAVDCALVSLSGWDRLTLKMQEV